MAQSPPTTPPSTGPSHAVPSALLKVQGSSKLAFGATTAALVTLASGGTAVLVAHATHGVSSPTSLPSGALPPDLAAGPGGLVVESPAGTTPVGSGALVPVDSTVQALQDALAHRRPPGRRTLTAPLVPLVPTTPPLPTPAPVVGPVAPPVVPPILPPVLPPVVLPPVVLPPVGLPTPPPARDGGGGQGHLGGEGTGTPSESAGPSAAPKHTGNGHGQGRQGHGGEVNDAHSNQGHSNQGHSNQGHSNQGHSDKRQADTRTQGRQAQGAKHARTSSLGRGRHAR